MKYLFLRQLRSFRKGILLNISVFFVTLLGIFLFSGLNAVGRNVRTSIDQFYVSQNLADYTVSKKLQIAQLDQIQSSLVIDASKGYDKVPTVINGVDRKVSLLLYSTMDFDVNIPQLVEGNMPNSSMEGLIDVGFAQANGVQIGDEIVVRVDEEDFTVLISGIAIFPDYLYKGDVIPKKEEIAIIKAYKPDLINFNNLYVDSDFSISQLRNELTNVSGINFSSARVYTLDDNTSVWRVKADIELINSLMNILPVVCLVALCLILYVNTSKKIEDESYNIGVMTACGLDRKKVVLSYVLPMMIWVIVAGVFGAILGILILPDVYVSILTRFYTLPNIVGGSYLYSIAIPLLVLIAITSLSLFFAISSTFRRTPVELMRGKAKNSVKILAKSKLPIVYKLSLRNSISYKKKFLFTTVSATLCLSLLFTAFLLDNSVENLQQTLYGDYYNYDATISWNYNDDVDYQEIEAEVKNSDYFDNVMFCLEFPASLNEKNISVAIIDEDNPCYNIYDGKEKIAFGNDGVYVPASYGYLDKITLTLYTTQEITLELMVAGTYTDIGMFGVMIPLSVLKEQAPIAHWYLTANASNYSKICCKTRDGVSKQEVDSFVSNLSQSYMVSLAIEEHTPQTDKFSKLFVVLDVTEVLLFIVCGIIMVLLILNISCLSIGERVKDYTIFKAMGVSERKFNMLSSIENYLSIFVAYLLSIPVGFLITNPIIKVVTLSTGVAVYAYAYWWSFVALFVGAAIITAISNVFINKRISKTNVANALKIKE